MDADERRFILKDETRQIIGCAMEVLNTLGHGLLEKPYERSLAVEFSLRSIPFVAQSTYDIIYKDICVGRYVPDLVVFGQIIVEMKCIDKISKTEIGQLINYLRISRLPIGIILNFKYPKLEWERIALHS